MSNLWEKLNRLLCKIIKTIEKCELSTCYAPPKDIHVKCFSFVVFAQFFLVNACKARVLWMYYIYYQTHGATYMNNIRKNWCQLCSIFSYE